MKQLKRLFIFLCLPFVSLMAHAEEVVHLTNGEWAPYTSAGLKHNGVFSRIVTEAFALEGIKVEYKFYPWKRGYKLAANGSADGSVTWAPTPDRMKDFYFSDPVTSNQKVFFHLKSYNFDWNSIDDLKDVKIGATSQYTYGELFDNAVKEGKIKATYIVNDKQNIKKLLAGRRISVFPMELEVGYALINSVLSPADAAKVTHHPKPVQETPICLVLSKKIDPERAKRLMAAFNRGLSRLKESGQYDQFVQESRQGLYEKADS